MAFQKGVEQRIIGTAYSGGIATAPETNIAATISIDGGAFGATTNIVSPISGGDISLVLTAAEMDADSIALIITSDETDPEHIQIYTEDSYTAARAGAIDTIAGDALLARKLLEADWETELSGGAYYLVLLEKGTATELLRKALKDINGAAITDLVTRVSGGEEA